MCAGYLFRILSSIYEYCRERSNNEEEMNECVKRKFREMIED